MSEGKDCGCWYSSNGYGAHDHPDGFNCAWCKNTGRCDADSVLSPRAATREFARLVVLNPELQKWAYNDTYVQHLPFLISCMGTEKALLHMLGKLVEGKDALMSQAVELSNRACPDLDAHLERNRLRGILKEVTSMADVLGPGYETSDHYNALRDINELLRDRT